MTLKKHSAIKDTIEITNILNSENSRIKSIPDIVSNGSFEKNLP